MADLRKVTGNLLTCPEPDSNLGPLMMVRDKNSRCNRIAIVTRPLGKRQHYFHFACSNFYFHLRDCLRIS